MGGLPGGAASFFLQLHFPAFWSKTRTSISALEWNGMEMSGVLHWDWKWSICYVCIGVHIAVHDMEFDVSNIEIQLMECIVTIFEFDDVFAYLLIGLFASGSVNS